MTFDDAYQPELGQALFGQPHQKYKCKEWLYTFLRSIDSELRRVMGNIHNGRYESPFDNTGAEYKNDVFHVVAYSWDDDASQPYNFKWRNVEISWYKYLGRGMSVNRRMTIQDGVEMLEECLASLRQLENGS